MEAIIAKTPRGCLDPDFGVTTSRTDEGAILASGMNGRAAGGFSSACNAELRATLRIAQRERDARRKKRDLLNDAVERANKLTVVIESRLGEFPDLDKAIGEECAALILRSTDFVAEPTLELSPELTRMADRKFSLENQLAVTRQASERLRQELEMVDSDLKDAEHLTDAYPKKVVASTRSSYAATVSTTVSVWPRFPCDSPKGGFPRRVRVIIASSGSHPRPGRDNPNDLVVDFNEGRRDRPARGGEIPHEPGAAHLRLGEAQR